MKTVHLCPYMLTVHIGTLTVPQCPHSHPHRHRHLRSELVRIVQKQKLEKHEKVSWQHAGVGVGEKRLEGKEGEERGRRFICE